MRRRARDGALLLAACALTLALLPRVVPKPLLVNRPGFSQEVLDRDGGLLHLSLASDERFRLFTPLAEIPHALVEATLLQEDRFFRWHPGVNPVALARAVRATYLGGGRRVGGSTLSMQVARLRFGLVTRTPRGKLTQILRALQLELFYTKDEILEAYLNLAPYGANVEGAGAASHVWFGKSVRELTRDEAWTLAVLPKSPAARSPETSRGRRALAAARRALALRWPQQAPPAALRGDEPLLRRRSELPFRAPHLALRLVAERPFEGRIESTLDPQLQHTVERQVALHIERSRRFGIRNAAVLVVDARSREVLAYVGSADHADATIEGAVDGVRGRRSPGSTLKPLLYAQAIDAGLIHPQSLLRDASLAISAWNPENYERDFLGPISATQALVRSRNLPAVQLARDLPAPGLHGLLAEAGIGGLRSADHYGLALALGGVELRLDELVELYAMLAAGGGLQPLRFARDADAQAAAPKRLLSREASFLVLEMLRENPRPGTDMLRCERRIGSGVAWKTGTSWGLRDAWAVGVAGPYAIGVWIGNFDGTPNPAFVGREAAGPLFFGIADALRATGGARETPLPRDLDLVEREVCALSGALPGAFCPSRKTTWMLPGVSPIAPCRIHREVWIDVASGLRACPGARANAEPEVYEFWPSDLLALFRQAGIARRTPPDYTPACAAADSTGLALRIELPQDHVVVQIRRASGETIPFSAVSDADGGAIDWFVDEAWVGRAPSGEAYFWPARPGRFSVRAVDRLGRSAARPLRVALAAARPSASAGAPN